MLFFQTISLECAKLQFVMINLFLLPSLNSIYIFTIFVIHFINIFYFEHDSYYIFTMFYPLRYELVTLQQLQSAAPQLPVYDVITSMFPRAKIKLNTQILVPSLKYTRRLSELISTSDRA